MADRGDLSWLVIIVRVISKCRSIHCSLTQWHWGHQNSAGFFLILPPNIKDDTIGWSLSRRDLNLAGARMRGWAAGPGQLNASAILDEATGKNSAQFRAETGFCDLIYCDFACFFKQTRPERVYG